MAISGHLIIFSQLVIGFTFVLSAIGKLLDFSAFRTSIENFRLLPKGFVLPFALAGILSEVVVIVFVALGRQFLLFGFSMAFMLLMIFTIAMITLLVRKIQVSCNCFGKSKNPVTRYDVLRNFLFMLCALAGWIMTAQDVSVSNVRIVDVGVLTIFALLFTLLSINISEIVAIFK